MPRSLRRQVAVAHVTSAHPYTDNRIHYRECQTLADAGYDVTLIAVDSDIPSHASDVRLVKIPMRPRFKRVLISSIQVIYHAIKSGAKVVHLHDPELIPFIPILRLTGRRVVYDAHEDLPMQVLSKPYLSHGGGRVMTIPAHLLVAFAGLAAHRIVAATDQVAARFKARKTIVVRNYPNLRTEEDSPPDKENILVYIGAISESRGIIEMLEATACKEFPDNWELHLAGRAGAKAMKAIEEKVDSSRVVYHGQLTPNRARDLLLRSKVGIVALASTPGHREALPTKMFEYFAAALPVIASDFPIWRQIIEEDNTGILIDETDPVAIARAVEFYNEAPGTHKKQSDNARRHALQVRNWESEGATLINAYDGLLIR